MTKPKISVVIPTYNQQDALNLTLHSFNRQAGNLAFEVLLIDDGSTDDTNTIVKRFEPNYNLRYLVQTNRGRAAARNKGINEASGEIIIFNDCDRAVSFDFIEAHYQTHNKKPNQIVVGDIQEFYFSNLVAKTPQILSQIQSNYSEIKHLARQPSYPKTVFKMYNSEGTTSYVIPWLSFLSGNISTPKSLLEKVNGFDENFKDWGFEHFELGFRLWQLDVTYNYNRQAPNYHFAHRRSANFYQEALAKSYTYFTNKYLQEKAVVLLKAFLTGNLSLQNYNNQVITNKDNFIDETEAIFYTTPISF